MAQLAAKAIARIELADSSEPRMLELFDTAGKLGDLAGEALDGVGTFGHEWTSGNCL